MRAGAGRCLWVYLPADPLRPQVVVGVYGDVVAGGDPEPDALLARGTKDQLVDGWNVFRLDRPVDVKVGAYFWIATGAKATLRVSTRTATEAVARGQHTAKVTGGSLDMPAPWKTAFRGNDKKYDLAAYVTE